MKATCQLTKKYANYMYILVSWKSENKFLLTQMVPSVYYAHPDLNGTK